LQLSETALHLVETWDDAQRFMGWLSERRPILGADSETTGLDWWNEELRLFQFGDRTGGWAIPWTGWGGLVQEVFREYKSPIVFHNSKFDVHFLERAGVKVDRGLIHDTMLMQQLVNPLELAGLKWCAKRYVDPRSQGGEKTLKDAMKTSGWTWATIPIDFGGYWIYSALDPVITSLLWEHHEPLIRKKGLGGIYELELDVNWILLDMEERGVAIDEEYCLLTYNKLLDYASEARGWLADTYGMKTSQGAPSIAPAILSQTLVDQGVTLTEKTPTGKWKLDEKVLSGISHPIVDTVQAIKRSEKWAKSYLGGMLEGVDAGRVHPSFKSMGAKTGRMSVSNPPLQQLPRDNPLIRKAFVAPEGNRLVAVDYSQVEARLMAHYAADEGLIRAFDQGDFFTEIGKRLFEDPGFEKSDPRRSIVKNTVYSKMYGAGPYKFAETAGLEVAEAQAMFDALAEQFPGIRRLDAEVVAQAGEREYPYIITHGRRRVAVDPGFEYKLVNGLIQGSAADVFKSHIRDLDSAGLTEYLVLLVHDEVVLDVPTEIAEDVLRHASEVMEDLDSFAVPLTVEGGIATNYGDVK
jgi:DNA polymerase-1